LGEALGEIAKELVQVAVLGNGLRDIQQGTLLVGKFRAVQFHLIHPRSMASGR